MKIYGLTGGIASGKSLAARYFAEAGIPVIDADTVARNLLEPETDVFHEVAAAFGDAILAAGKINREKLAEIVFHDAAARSRLNAIVHPRVLAEISDRLRQLAAEDHRIAIVEAALLGENGLLPPGFDGLILITAPLEVRLERLVTRRGMAPAAARARAAAQTDPESKRTLAQVIIDNTGSPEQLREAVRRAVRLLLNEEQ